MRSASCEAVKSAVVFVFAYSFRKNVTWVLCAAMSSAGISGLGDGHTSQSAAPFLSFVAFAVSLLKSW
jgi:hypothetical protein